MFNGLSTRREFVSAPMPEQTMTGTSTTGASGHFELAAVVELDASIISGIIKLQQEADDIERQYTEPALPPVRSRQCPSEVDELSQLFDFALKPVTQLLDADGSPAFWRTGQGPIRLQAPATVGTSDAGQPARGPGTRHRPLCIPDFGLMMPSAQPDAASCSSTGPLLDYLVPGEAKLSSVIEGACRSFNFDLVAAYQAGEIVAGQLISQPFAYMREAKADMGILASYKYLYVLRRLQENQLSVSWGCLHEGGLPLGGNNELIVSAARCLLSTRTLP